MHAANQRPHSGWLIGAHASASLNNIVVVTVAVGVASAVAVAAVVATNVANIVAFTTATVATLTLKELYQQAWASFLLQTSLLREGYSETPFLRSRS